VVISFHDLVCAVWVSVANEGHQPGGRFGFSGMLDAFMSIVVVIIFHDLICAIWVSVANEGYQPGGRFGFSGKTDHDV
jgi:hypothetical protein